jgi:hypothetical protein
MFEVFKRNLGKVSMCWSQPARVDTCAKKKGRRKNFFLHRMGLRHPPRAGR